MIDALGSALAGLAVRVLIEIEPALLHALRDTRRKRIPFELSKSLGVPNERMARDLSLYLWTPSAWKHLAARWIRSAYSTEELAKFTAGLINNGGWVGQTKAIKTLLLDTPGILDKLLTVSDSRNIFKSVIDELSHQDVQRILETAIKRNDDRTIGVLAHGIVDRYGPDKEYEIIGGSEKRLNPKFLSRLSEARWTKAKSKKVLKHINEDLNKSSRRDEAIAYITNKSLLSALKAKSRKLKQA